MGTVALQHEKQLVSGGSHAVVQQYPWHPVLYYAVLCYLCTKSMSSLTASCVTLSIDQIGSLTSNSESMPVAGCPTHSSALESCVFEIVQYSVVATLCCTIFGLPCAVLACVLQDCPVDCQACQMVSCLKIHTAGNIVGQCNFDCCRLQYISNVKDPCLCRQASEATSQLTAATDGHASAQQEITQLKALAAERQKRFVMLNGTFKKKEDGMRERAEAAERQMAEAQSIADAAVAASQTAAKV